MNELMDSTFGPLGKQYCDWFYWLSVISLILFVISIVSILYTLLFEGEKFSTGLLVNLLAISFVYFIPYFENRLLYTMCQNSTR